MEIDETLCVKRNYDRGRTIANEVWLFGGVERDTNHVECFITPVERRNHQTLLPLIEEYIRPGSIIFSDMWAAYGGIPLLPNGYQHFIVNHSRNFVNPLDGTHTQNVESMWQKLKAKAKRRFGDSRNLFDTYIQNTCGERDSAIITQFFFKFLVSSCYAISM